MYHCQITNKSEFGGLLFLATETKDNIQCGLKFVKDVLNYARTQDLIFYVDKDFDYVDVIYLIFVGCVIFFCSIHTYRYIREKILPSSKKSDGSEVPKAEAIDLFKKLRDSPTEELYN